MSTEELNQLRSEIYEKFYNATGEDKAFYKKILNFFDYNLKLRHALDTISKIGVSHL
jgi:hypothetical protein